MPSILYIINGSGLCSQMSGSFKRIEAISRRLLDRGWDVQFLTTRGTQEICRRIGLDIPLYLVPASIFKNKETCLFDRAGAYLISTVGSLWMIPRLPKFDLVFSDTDYFCDVIPALIYQKVKKVPWIGMIHHQMDLSIQDFKQLLIRIPSLPLQRFSHYLMRKHAAGIFVYRSGMGEEVALSLQEKGGSGNKIFYVNNGVNIAILSSLPEEKKEYLACFVGGIRLGKGIFDLVKIWKEVTNIIPSARLAVIGDGPRMEELRTKVSENNLNNTVILIGHSDQVSGFMKKSRVFLFPSYEEGWGIAICEAMACGLPVVAYDLPGYRGIFDGGIVTASLGDWQELARQVVRIMRDQELYRELQIKSAAKVADFDWEKIATQEVSIFKRVIAEYEKSRE